jgi:hypothetical protein
MTMLQMQADMNAKVNQDWLGAGYPFLRAAVVEGVEGIDHHGWKWWKSQQTDIDQLQMELIDIFHFILSDFIVRAKGNLQYAAASIIKTLTTPGCTTGTVCLDNTEYRFNEMDILRKLEILVGLSVVRRVSVPLFASIMFDCGLDWVELYQRYIAKNVLNIFRQDHGYKQGTYRKIWAGREDNEHLTELLAEQDAKSPRYKETIYSGLQQRYLAMGATG